jgi:repressor LexA
MPRRPLANLRRSPPAPTPRLTARQQQILDWIRGFIESRGMPPTRAEIAAGLGFSTASSAEDHLQALAKKGALELVPGASRGLRLKDVPGVPIQGTLPLVGRVAAGQPMLAAENVEARYRVDPALFSPRADYLLRVRGMSMKDAGILDGDLLAVHRTADARSGQIVVAPPVRRCRRQSDRQAPETARPRNRAAGELEFEPIVVNPAHTDLAIERHRGGTVAHGRVQVRGSRSVRHSPEWHRNSRRFLMVSQFPPATPAYLLPHHATRPARPLQKAFGATEVMRFPAGRQDRHAELKIAGGNIMLADGRPKWAIAAYSHTAGRRSA